ncbi:TOBE domain-containing protein [Derxia gummosa]|uniref:TOBE domain-containing protein n=1 Tax=Derxia gummosa DSM 723 TaxID=1121388 RepID=A0A8B6X7I7_9BURK|nr:TOBE domain-containing protein [Derxia gummosa]
MTISARNVFDASITALVPGKVNIELELTTATGLKLVSTVTADSARALGLAVGKAVVAIVKAPSVLVATGTPGKGFSARNQLAGSVAHVTPGPVNAEVAIDVGGALVHAVVTNDAVKELGLAAGVPAMAVFKAGSVMVGVTG